MDKTIGKYGVIKRLVEHRTWILVEGRLHRWRAVRMAAELNRQLSGLAEYAVVRLEA